MKELAQFRNTVQRKLERWFASKRRWMIRHYPDLVPIFDVGAEFTLRKDSKRVRPYLVTLGYRLAGGRNMRLATELSLVTEFVQSHLLIHDDIIDRDVERRGGPTAHIALRKHSPNRQDEEHYGESQALLLGSIFGIWAREMVLAAAVTPVIRVRLMEKLEEMLVVTHYGQMLDVLIGEQRFATVQQIREVYRSKTARYTAIGPLQFGAMAAGASWKDLAALQSFGEPFGIAFQMLNDLHGLFPSDDQLDNAGTSDIAEGKKTLLFAYAMQKLRGRPRAELARLLASRSASRATLYRIRALVKRSSAVAACRQEANRLIAKSVRALTRHTRFAIKEVLLLQELVRFVVRKLS